MITTRAELLDIVKKDIEERGGDEIVLSFIMTDDIFKDGSIFHPDQVFEKDELIKMFMVVTNLINIPINDERCVKILQSLCANRMKTEREIFKEMINMQMVKVADFEIGKYPVTQKQYEEVMGSNPSKFKGPNQPVEQVWWCDAVVFCNKLSEKEGLQKAYSDDYGSKPTCDFTANGYRLPTVNEWKFASEGGKKSRGYKYSGSDDINDVAWDDCNSDEQTHEVGMKKPNELGIYDMHGNVWEWCWDSFCGSDRRIRGGSCLSDADTCTKEYHESPWTRKDLIGFRLVRTLPTKEPEIRREDVTFEEKPVVSRENVSFPSVKKKPETKVTPVIESGCGCNTSGLTAQEQFNKQRDIYQALVEIDEQHFGNQYLTDMFNKYTDRGIDLPSQRGFNYNAWKHIKF